VLVGFEEIFVKGGSTLSRWRRWPYSMPKQSTLFVCSACPNTVLILWCEGLLGKMSIYDGDQGSLVTCSSVGAEATRLMLLVGDRWRRRKKKNERSEEGLALGLRMCWSCLTLTPRCVLRRGLALCLR